MCWRSELELYPEISFRWESILGDGAASSWGGGGENRFQ